MSRIGAADLKLRGYFIFDGLFDLVSEDNSLLRFTKLARLSFFKKMEL